MEKIYIEIETENSLADNSLLVGNQMFAECNTYKTAYIVACSELDSTYIFNSEFNFIDRHFPSECSEAEESDRLDDFLEELFDNRLDESDYEELLDILEVPIKTENFESDLEPLLNNTTSDSFYKNGLVLISDYLSSLSHEERLRVIAFYVLSQGFGFEDQLISDIQSEVEENSNHFEYVGIAEYI
ncbi:TPA: hypothetical protein ACGWER_002015 [Streptococcus agalactiae]|nr:hypothetical protein [Streptococcus agalactiae]HEO2267353.1 hypothetical protein [Streptococcus agalactiae]HEO7770500.1 hypothetical protein [Streptococcus agalactiae]